MLASRPEVVRRRAVDEIPAHQIPDGLRTRLVVRVTTGLPQIRRNLREHRVLGRKRVDDGRAVPDRLAVGVEVSALEIDEPLRIDAPVEPTGVGIVPVVRAGAREVSVRVGRARPVRLDARQAAARARPRRRVAEPQAHAVVQLARDVRRDTIGRPILLERLGLLTVRRRLREAHRARRRRADRRVAAIEPQAIRHDRPAAFNHRLPVRDVVERSGEVLGFASVRGLEPQARANRTPETVVVRVVEPAAPVERVATALGDGADDAAGCAREFRVVAARLHLHLVQEVSDDRLSRRPVLQVGRVHAIDDEAILRPACAVDRDSTGSVFAVGARRHGNHAREVPTFRDALDRSRRNGGRVGVLLDVDERRFSSHLDGFRNRREGKHEIDLEHLAQAETNVGNLARRKTRERSGDFVGAGGQRRETVEAHRIRGDRHGSAASALRFYRSAREHRSLRIFDGSLNRAGLLLGCSRHGDGGCK